MMNFLNSESKSSMQLRLLNRKVLKASLLEFNTFTFYFNRFCRATLKIMSVANNFILFFTIFAQNFKSLNKDV